MSKFTDKQAEEEFTKYSEKVTADDVSGVLDKEESISNKITGPLKKFSGNIKTLFSMIKDYKSGKYKELPWTTVAGIVGSLIYVFSPLDLIPDVIPIAGLLDDAAVIGFCLTAISKDVEKYKLWKESNDVEYRIVND
jgi:uncharacterized membrane protein YkvA (DUF1232 family)